MRVEAVLEARQCVDFVACDSDGGTTCWTKDTKKRCEDTVCPHIDCSDVPMAVCFQPDQNQAPVRGYFGQQSLPGGRVYVYLIFYWRKGILLRVFVFYWPREFHEFDWSRGPIRKSQMRNF